MLSHRSGGMGARSARRSLKVVARKIRSRPTAPLRIPLRQAATDRPDPSSDEFQEGLAEGQEEADVITARWHDGRHTFITELAESGEASDETIRQVAGHISPRILKHYYSHIGMKPSAAP